MGIPLPRILVIDDLFGRQLTGRPNRERSNLCGMYGLRDVTEDQAVPSEEDVVNPIADAVFFRGQLPLCANVGDTVENDLKGTLNFVRQGMEPDDSGRAGWALVLLDLCFYTGPVTESSDQRLSGMPEGRVGDDDVRQYFGLRVLEQLHAAFPFLPVIVLSSKQRSEVSESFTAHGALGFIPRTDSSGPVQLRDYLWRHGLIPDPSGRIVGNSSALLLGLRAARRAAADRRNILIRGERGSGKELMAEYIHQSVSDSESLKPYVVVDSGALTPSLYASELFGHLRGSYTGADKDRQGKIVLADGGDLFLDEIGNMPPDVQAGLLRAIEMRMVSPLGATTDREVDVRFIAATNEDIEMKTAAGGGFRADLLDRLREGGTIILPPLRERRGDIPLLVEKFVLQAEKERAGAMKRLVTPAALEKLLSYEWPGNVRELRNCIFKAVKDHVDVEYLVPDHLVFDQTSTVQTGLGRTAVEHEMYASPVSALVDVGVVGTTEPSDIGALINRLRAVEIDARRAETWAGAMPRLQEAYAEVLLRFLRAALIAHLRPTTEWPTGEVKYTPAIRLMTGDRSLPSTQAARLVRRLVEMVPNGHERVKNDPVLAEAYRRAKGRGKRKNGTN